MSRCPASTRSGAAWSGDIIVDLQAAGKTVFFSTHILRDAESLCDRVALLRGGRLLKVGGLDEILPIDVTHLEVLAAGSTSRRSRGWRAAPDAGGDRWRLEVDAVRWARSCRRVEAAGGRVLSVHRSASRSRSTSSRRWGPPGARLWD